LSVLKWINKYLEEIPMVLLLIAMVLCSGAQVFMRYVVNFSLAWSEEFSRFAFVWTGFFAVGYCYRRSASLRIDMFLNMLPRKGRAVLEIIVNLISFALFAVLLRTSYQIVASTAAIGQVSPAMQLPMQVVYAAPVVGFAIALFRLAQCTVSEIKVLMGKNKDGEGEEVCR